MTRVAVVGGGIAGVLAARILADRSHEVVLIEREPAVGGLLRSACNEQGDSFDFGTHFLGDSGDAELDRVLFGHLDLTAWHRIETLKAGAYFGGALNADNAFVDVRCLPEAVHAQAMVQLLSAAGREDASDLEAQLRGTFGDILTERLFRPALRKLFGCELATLAPDAHKLFGLGRIIGFDSFATRELKRSPVYNERLNFVRATDSPSRHASYYPRDGGIGRWVDGFAADLRARGVDFRCGRTVKRIERNGKQVHGLTLDDDTTVACDRLVWTAPLFLCLRASGITVAGAPPTLRLTSLHHFTFDRPFVTPVSYLTCYDERFETFRVTMYPNVQSDRPWHGRYPCTVEVLSGATPDLDVLRAKVGDELVQMGVVPEGARVLYQASELVREGFPVLTPAFAAGGKLQRETLERELDNVVCLGKGSGASFFMADVLAATWNKLRAS